jgi:ribonuclease HI
MTKTFEVYTDGSYHPQKDVGTWASKIIADSEKLISGIKNGTSQHEMELLAVINSLDYLNKFYDYPAHIKIYTDSEYVLKLLSRKKRLQSNNFQTKAGKPIRNLEIIKKFYDIEERLHYISFVKVESHQKRGVSKETDNNRVVDRLSRKMLRQEVLKKG